MPVALNFIILTKMCEQRHKIYENSEINFLEWKKSLDVLDKLRAFGYPFDSDSFDFQLFKIYIHTIL